MTPIANRQAVAGATILDLCKAVRARMTEVVYGFWFLDTKAGVERSPQVINGYLPPILDPRDAAQDRFPFVIVRATGGVDTPQQADANGQATVEIILGTYSDTDDGHDDVLLLIQAIRESLHAAPVLHGTAFEHTGPLTWGDIETPRPQWLGKVTTTWTIPRPVRVEADDPQRSDDQ